MGEDAQVYAHNTLVFPRETSVDGNNADAASGTGSPSG